MTDVEIRVDPEVFEYLKAKAEPFVDTPNSVLRRLFGLAAPVSSAVPLGAEPGGSGARPVNTHRARSTVRRTKSPAKRTRVPSGSILPEERYELPLLRALADMGGEGPAKEVVDAIGRELKDDLTPLDREPLNSGGVRWQNRIQFVRLRLIERGLVRRDTPRGSWGLTEGGLQFVNDHGQQS